ncbi:phospholipase D-like domain-containing protein [Limnoglobus roseus]|uniref:Cardiolipin synthase n=1 Tax=Limnoglobus roseus TaxID=2598579 RepID=A0A5C1ABQ1_9BACT|nr:phospholipase D-like domain-containing protein [Limnoglobus roseus]QEL16799.1 cardiolipin synthase [Limnoglobus roseus]
MADVFASYWPYVTSGVLLAADLWATAHAVLYKRDNRAALGWVGLIWLVPVAGIALYTLFGIKRIRRKARRLRRNRHPERLTLVAAEAGGSPGLRRLVGEVTGRPVSGHSRIQPLPSGEAAYAAMLAAIAGAERSVGLSTYIFGNDATGHAFVAALAATVNRGVAVRVLVDDIGSRYSFPSVVGRLRAAGVPVARFMPSFLPWRFAYAQLRNHRKILVIDGIAGFTGGMNIRDGHDARTHPRFPIADCHFRIDGPVLADVRAVFADDWQFATGEQLDGAAWFPDLSPAGRAEARGIASGPDDDRDTLRLALLGAIASARRSVRIVTPYFVPEGGLLSALGVAALRGVAVDVVVPEHNNLRLVHWAMLGQVGDLIGHGGRVWLTPLPFDHTKLLVVDDAWCLIGSANWDARSLRLNFELNVECYDAELVGELAAMAAAKIARGRPLTTAELNRRNLFFRLRDGVARLATPYL